MKLVSQLWCMHSRQIALTSFHGLALHRTGWLGADDTVGLAAIGTIVLKKEGVYQSLAGTRKFTIYSLVLFHKSHACCNMCSGDIACSMGSKTRHTLREHCSLRRSPFHMMLVHIHKSHLRRSRRRWHKDALGRMSSLLYGQERID